MLVSKALLNIFICETHSAPSRSPRVYTVDITYSLWWVTPVPIGDSPVGVSLNLFNLFNCVYISSLFLHMLTCLIVVARRERNESWPTQRWQPLGARRWPLRLHIGPDYTRKRQLSWPKIRVMKASSVPTSSWDGKTSSRPLITMYMECDIGLTLWNGLELWNGLDMWIMSM